MCLLLSRELLQKGKWHKAVSDWGKLWTQCGISWGVCRCNHNVGHSVTSPLLRELLMVVRQPPQRAVITCDVIRENPTHDSICLWSWPQRRDEQPSDQSVTQPIMYGMQLNAIRVNLLHKKRATWNIASRYRLPISNSVLWVKLYFKSSQMQSEWMDLVRSYS